MRPSTAPTAITLGNDAGNAMVPSPSLPEEATITIPRAKALSTAWLTAWDGPSPPRLMLMTLTGLVPPCW